MLKEVKEKSISEIMRKTIKQIESNRYADWKDGIAPSRVYITIRGGLKLMMDVCRMIWFKEKYQRPRPFQRVEEKESYDQEW